MQRKTVQAALTTAAVRIPFAAFYGLLARSPPGPGLALQAPGMALLGAETPAETALPLRRERPALVGVTRELAAAPAR